MSDAPDQRLLDALLDSWDRNNTILLNLLRPGHEPSLRPPRSSCSSTRSGTRATITVRWSWPSRWRAAQWPIRKPGRSRGASGCARS